MNIKSPQCNIFLIFISAFFGAMVAVLLVKYFSPNECDILPSMKEIAEVSESHNNGDVQLDEDVEIVDDAVPGNEDSEVGAN